MAVQAPAVAVAVGAGPGGWQVPPWALVLSSSAVTASVGSAAASSAVSARRPFMGATAGVCVYA